MKVYHNLESLPLFRKAVITIGSFDGVHSGHRKILHRINELAKEIGGESIVITFHPHPRHVLAKGKSKKPLKLLNTIEEKIAHIEELQVDHLVVVPFSETFAQQSPDAYIKDFLIKRFNPAYIVIGYDHQFGKNRTGNIDYLKRFETSSNFRVIEIPKQEVSNLAVSSTKIRNALEAGEVQKAADLLNHKYFLTGTVEKGLGIGRKLGYPTANLKLTDQHKLIPAAGIYAVYANHAGKRYQAMLYIGNRPTIEGNDQQVIEVNIFDFNQDIYDEALTVKFAKFIRGDVHYKDLDDLKRAIANDKVMALKIFEEIETNPVKKKVMK